MSSLQNIHLFRTRYLLAGALILTLLTASPLAATAGARSGGSFSGDDAYDRAAGAFPWLYASAVDASFSGDDAYDRAAGSNPGRSSYAAASSFSGDDAYDAAAGGNLGLAAIAAGNSDDAIACDPAALAIAGGYSGDDTYDPAAGGSPDGSPIVMACALDSDSAFN